jgi:asparagine synthase (glutamine-hydrolysing)
MVRRVERSLFIRNGAASGETEAVIGLSPFDSRWHWNGDSLTIEVDRFGLQPVFYRQAKNFFAVSSAIETLRQPGDEFDWCAIGLFLRLSYFLCNDTPFREIRRAPPDSILRWKDGVFTIEERGRPPVRAYAGSRQNAKKIYTGLFRENLLEVVNRYPDMPISCPLSGGRDSRHIALELKRLGIPFHAYTIDVDVSNEGQISAALCAQYGIPHTVAPMGPISLETNRRLNVATDYGTLEHRWTAVMAQIIPRSILFDGVAGDVLSAGHFSSEKLLSQFRRGAVEEIAEGLLTGEDTLQGLLRPWLYAKMDRAEARQRLIEELARHVDTPSPVASFYLASRTRRVASLMGTAVFENGMGMMPFLVDPVYDFLFSLPGEMTVDFQLHTEMLAEAFPECRVPYPEKHPGRPERALMAEAMKEAVKWRDIVSLSTLLPRLTRAMVDGTYALRSDWLVTVPQYLHQIGVTAP